MGLSASSHMCYGFILKGMTNTKMYDKYDFLEDCGVDVDSFNCTWSCPKISSFNGDVYIFAVDSEIDCYQANVIELGELYVDPGWDAELHKFCEAYEIEAQKPGWLLSTSYF